MTTIVKGNKVAVAKEADDEGVLGGLDNFKVQIIQCEDDENAYRIRSVADKGSYLYGVNDKMCIRDSFVISVILDKLRLKTAAIYSDGKFAFK